MQRSANIRLEREKLYQWSSSSRNFGYTYCRRYRFWSSRTTIRCGLPFRRSTCMGDFPGEWTSCQSTTTKSSTRVNLNAVPDFLSRIEGEEPTEEEGDYGGLLNAVGEEQPEYEDNLTRIERFIRHGTISSVAQKELKRVRLQAKSFAFWEGRLIRREGKVIFPVVPIANRDGILQFLHDSVGHWDSATTRKMIMARYWWPQVGKDVFRYVKTCDTCQRMSKLPPYPTKLTKPITSLFEVFSIDFAGPFPETQRSYKHLLVCVEHLTG